MVNVRALSLLVVGLCLVSAPLLFRAPIPRSVQFFSFPFRVFGLVVMFYSLRTYRGEPIDKTLKYLLVFFLFIIGAFLAVAGVFSIEHAPFVVFDAHIKMLSSASAAFGYGTVWFLLGAFCIWLGLRLIPKFRNERAAPGDPIDKPLRYILLFFLSIIGFSLVVTGISSTVHVPPILIDASKQKHFFWGALVYGAVCSQLGAFCIWLGVRLIPRFRNKASTIFRIFAVFAVLTLMLVSLISAFLRGLDGELALIILLLVLLSGILAFVALGLQNRQERAKYLHYFKAFLAVFNLPIGTISSRDILNPGIFVASVFFAIRVKLFAPHHANIGLWFYIYVSCIFLVLVCWVVLASTFVKGLRRLASVRSTIQIVVLLIQLILVLLGPVLIFMLFMAPY